MGSSNLVTQPGNSTSTWWLRGSSLSRHDAIVPKLESATDSGIRLSNITLSAGPDITYKYEVTVVGPGAISFRINNESIG